MQSFALESFSIDHNFEMKVDIWSSASPLMSQIYVTRWDQNNKIHALTVLRNWLTRMQPAPPADSVGANRSEGLPEGRIAWVLYHKGAYITMGSDLLALIKDV